MGCLDCTSEDNTAESRPKYRVCTDIFWLILLILFWIILIIIAIFSFVYGNPRRLINGYDSFGNTCGFKHNQRFQNLELSGLDTSDKPYLFFMDIKELRQTLKICVNNCPKRKLEKPSDLYEYYIQEKTKLCRYNYDIKQLESANATSKDLNFMGPCPPLPVYQSTPVIHRCIPSKEHFQKLNVYKFLSKWDLAQEVFSDLYTTWPLIVGISCLALIVSLVLVGLMHYLSTIISWLICVLVVVASTGLCGVLWWAYYSIKKKHAIDADTLGLIEGYLRNETAVQVLSILATITMIILVLVVFFLKNKLSGLTALFEESGKCMLNLPGLTIPPLIAFACLIIFLVFWVIVIICIISSNYPVVNVTNNVKNISVLNPFDKTGDQKNLKNMYVEYLDSKWIQNMMWIYFIGLIWTSEFIFACQQFTLAGAVAFWYFKKPTDAPTFYAMGKLFKYHLGSVAKGSFIITIFKVPRLILTYLYTKLKKSEDKGSECASCCLKCCICGFWILENFLRFLNHNAYTVIAIESINFCPAARIAWNAMATNALQVAVVNSVGDFILFLGKLFVAIICGLITVILVKGRDDVNFYIGPVIFVILFSFFIAHIILSLFEVVVDTLFLCVCEDKIINGSAGRWKQSNLAKLVGEEPLDSIDGVEDPIQRVELMPINQQPFKSSIARM